jgi:hypothetical protein
VQDKVLENILKEKIHILVQLQKMARGINKQGKAVEKIVWMI